MNSRQPIRGGARPINSGLQTLTASRPVAPHNSNRAFRHGFALSVTIKSLSWSPDARKSPTAQRSPAELIALKRGGAELALGSGSTPRRLREVAEDFRAATIRTRTSSAGNVAQRKFVTGGVEYLSVLYDEKSRFARRFGRT